jgi:predicted small lipoprotein YifL
LLEKLRSNYVLSGTCGGLPLALAARVKWVLAAIAALAGCGLYFPDDGKQVCNTPDSPPSAMRDPETGACRE